MDVCCWLLFWSFSPNLTIDGFPFFLFKKLLRKDRNFYSFPLLQCVALVVHHFSEEDRQAERKAKEEWKNVYILKLSQCCTGLKPELPHIDYYEKPCVLFFFFLIVSTIHPLLVLWPGSIPVTWLLSKIVSKWTRDWLIDWKRERELPQRSLVIAISFR